MFQSAGLVIANTCYDTRVHAPNQYRSPYIPMPKGRGFTATFGNYRLQVNAEGFLPARTAWFPVSEGEILTLPDLTLKRPKGFRVVSGRVIDRDGKPVQGASVSQAGDGSAKTDADGRFRLTGVSNGSALVSAEAPEFQFGGAIVGDGANPVEIHLARLDEPPIATLKTLPSPLSRAEERALARELLEPILPFAQQGRLGILNASVITALARVNPGRVLEMIENRAIRGSSLELMRAALGQFEDDPTVAIATIEDDLNPGSRAAAWLAFEDYHPTLARAERENFLDRALTDARQVERDEAKLNLLGQIANRWLELGSLERARPILLEGQKIVADLPKNTWSHEAEMFGEILAAIDLQAALALFERRGNHNISLISDSDLSSHKAKAAIQRARLDPAEAERLIAPPAPLFYERSRFVLKVAQRMASVDLPRAHRLLESLSDSRSEMQGNATFVAFGLGFIAEELAETNPTQARGLLKEAFNSLRKIAVNAVPGQGQIPVANLMAELLPIVERLEPDRLAERIWLIVASRPPSVQNLNVQHMEEAIVLAMLVSRYDRAIADVIAAPVLERLQDLLIDDSTRPYNASIPTICKSLTTYDPRAISLLLRGLPDPLRKPPPKLDAGTAASFEFQFRQAAAEILGFSPGARPREASRIGDLTSPYRLDN